MQILYFGRFREYGLCPEAGTSLGEWQRAIGSKFPFLPLLEVSPFGPYHCNWFILNSLMTPFERTGADQER